MKTALISFYADTERNGGYGKAAAKLKEQCIRYNIKHHIIRVPSQGTWAANTRYKPMFIFKMLEKLDQPVLWLDVDNIIRKPAALNIIDKLTCDVAAPEGPNPKGRAMVNLLYFNNTDNARRFLTLWIEKCTTCWHGDHTHFVDTWDQVVDDGVDLCKLPYTFSVKSARNPAVIAVKGTSSKSRDDFFSPGGIERDTRRTKP